MTESGVKPKFEAVFSADGLKVVRLTVPAGSLVPEHHANIDVVITVVRGHGQAHRRSGVRDVRRRHLDAVELEAAAWSLTRSDAHPR